MEDKKKLLAENELDQVVGGVLKPIQVERGGEFIYTYICQYCGLGYRTQTELDDHVKVCPQKPKNVG